MQTIPIHRFMWFHVVIYFWGRFSFWRVFISACIIILDGYLHSHPSALYITCFVIFPLPFHLLSIHCFMLFFCPALFIITLWLYFSFFCVATSWLSHALQAWWYPNPRGNYWENISSYQCLSGYAPSQFLQLVLLISWMKNDNTQSPDRFETGWWELFTSN